MSAKLSPIAVKFASLFYSKKVVSGFNKNNTSNIPEDILRKSRLSLMTISESPGHHANTTEYRLYDQISNSFFDCVVRNEIDHTGAVTERYIPSVKIFHNDYKCMREFEYGAAHSVLPLLALFEDRVAKSYYEKHDQYMPIIEAMTTPVKNYFVTTMRAILNGESVSSYFKAQAQAEQEKHDKPGSGECRYQGSLKSFLDYEYHQVLDFSITSDILFNIFSGNPGYSFGVFQKKDKTMLHNTMLEINQSYQERVFITAQDHEEFMSPKTVKGHADYIRSKVQKTVNETCADLTDEELARVKNRLWHYLHIYANGVVQYLQVTAADQCTPDKALTVDKLSRVNILKDFRKGDQALTPEQMYRAFHESGLYNYLMS